MQNAYLVYNPAAGRYPSLLLAERAAELLRNHGWEINLEATQSGGHLLELARRAAAEEMHAFFIVGGDGSINRALPGLMGSRTALGILPAGTGNVWAQELGLPGLTWSRWMALEESALQLVDAEVRQVDVGLSNGHPFLLWAGVGLDAFIAHRIEPRSRWEKHFSVVQYAASAIWNASFWHGVRLNVTADDRTISGHFLLGVVSNIHLYAGGLAELSPDARLDDGIMELWLFKGETLGDTVQVAWDVWNGRHEQSDQAIQIPFRRLVIDSAAPTYLQVDGEPVESSGSRVSVTIQPRALRVLVPRSASPRLFIAQNHSAPVVESDGDAGGQA